MTVSSHQAAAKALLDARQLLRHQPLRIICWLALDMVAS